MKSIITLKTSKLINNINTNIKDKIFNQLDSHIIKEYNNQNNNLNINILHDNNHFYYIINLNNHNYNGKLQSNEIHINIHNYY